MTKGAETSVRPARIQRCRDSPSQLTAPDCRAGHSPVIPDRAAGPPAESRLVDRPASAAQPPTLMTKGYGQPRPAPQEERIGWVLLDRSPGPIFDRYSDASDSCESRVDADPHRPRPPHRAADVATPAGGDADPGPGPPRPPGRHVATPRWERCGRAASGSSSPTPSASLTVHVVAASLQDREGAKRSLLWTRLDNPTVTQVWADQGCAGRLVQWAADILRRDLDIVRKQSGQRGFQVQPERWAVERPSAWITMRRRMAGDHERDPSEPRSAGP
jgi:transposase